VAWTTLINSIFLPGKKILGSTGMALRDNPVAIAEGATGAPRVQLPAVERLVPGTSIRLRSDPAVIVAGTASAASWTTTHSLAVMQAGTISVGFEFRRSGGAGSVGARIIRRRAGSNGLINSWTNSTTTFSAISQDVTVQPGDLISIQLEKKNGTGTDVEARNQRFCTDAATYLWPCGDTAYGEIEGNPTVNVP